MRKAIAGALVMAVLVPTGAHAAAGSGPRETVEVKNSTSAPGSPVGVTYTATFRNPSSPSGTPPPLRRLVLLAAPGARVDTSVPARCAATDAELKEKGEAACPAASRIGHGTADVKPVGFPAIHYDTVVFNAENQQVELLKGNGPSAPAAVVRGYFRGRTFDSPIPTCLTGGYVPKDCPFDQVTLLRNTVVTPAYSRGGGGYATTPPPRPPSGGWRGRGSFFFRGGGLGRVTPRPPPPPPATEGRGRPR